MIKNASNKVKVLSENFVCDDSSESFRDYVIFQSENDPGFFRWLFDDDNLSDFECFDDLEFECFLSDFI